MGGGGGETDIQRQGGEEINRERWVEVGGGGGETVA